MLLITLLLMVHCTRTMLCAALFMHKPEIKTNLKGAIVVFVKWLQHTAIQNVSGISQESDGP